MANRTVFKKTAFIPAEAIRMKAVSVCQSKVVVSEHIVEADGQVFTAEREAVTIRAAQHVVIPISEETIFGDEAEVVVQLDGYTRLEAQFESGSGISFKCRYKGNGYVDDSKVLSKFSIKMFFTILSGRWLSLL